MGTAIVALGSWVPANAQQAPGGTISAQQKKFNIPAQSLSSALTLFGRQSGLQVSVASAIARGQSSPGVSGRFSAKAALAKLMAGTGLGYHFNSAGTVIIAAPGTVARVNDGSLLLDTIVVTAPKTSVGSGFMGTPDWVYETPSSTSVISSEAIKNSSVRNTRDLLDNVAGVYANRSEAQNPGISINIRGLQDQGRINTMIDGARQNFQRSAHGATQRTYVDSAFIRQVDVEKSTTSGVGSVGSLGGSVNFRTLLAKDLIRPGRKWGIETNSTTGTNEYNFNGSLAAAFSLSDHFKVLGGISYKNIGAFDIGKKGSVKQSTTYDGAALLFSGQKVASGLFKVELTPSDDLKLTFGWVRNNSKFSTGYFDNLFGGGILRDVKQDVVNDTLTGALDWKPVNRLIDFKARLYYNRTTNEELSPYFIVPGNTGSGEPTKYQMGTLGGSLQNTSRFDTVFGKLSLNYGGEAFQDKGKSQLNGGQYVLFDIATNSYIDYSDILSGGTPTGERIVAGGFGNIKLEHNNWLTVKGGLRYDWYNISGNTTIFASAAKVLHPASGVCLLEIGGTCYYWSIPAYIEYFSPTATDVSIDNTDSAFLPSLTVAAKLTDWLQPFVKYSKSFRPPSVMESFINGGHGGQTISGYAPNPNLKAERASTYELGVNISHNTLFFADDKIRIKAVGFSRIIKDYISFGIIRNAQNDQQYTSYLNLNGPTRMKGLEIEASYDAGYFYLGGAYTYIKTKLADNYTRSGGSTIPINAGQGAAIIFEQPRERFKLDVGVRLFEKKLTIGGRMTYVGDTAPILGSLQQNYKMDGYKTYDLYGSYKFNDNVKLSYSVKNLTDLAYAPAVGATFYAAPGRTFTVSLRSKF